MTMYKESAEYIYIINQQAVQSKLHVGYSLTYWVKPEEVGKIKMIKTLKCQALGF